MKFRKKPVIIDAQQWFPTKPVSGVEFPSERCTGPLSNCGWIETLEGGHVVSPSDWIITGVKGEKYPCKQDIFEITYEPIEDFSVVKKRTVKRSRRLDGAWRKKRSDAGKKRNKKRNANKKQQ